MGRGPVHPAAQCSLQQSLGEGPLHLLEHCWAQFSLVTAQRSTTKKMPWEAFDWILSFKMDHFMFCVQIGLTCAQVVGSLKTWGHFPVTTLSETRSFKWRTLICKQPYPPHVQGPAITSLGKQSCNEYFWNGNVQTTDRILLCLSHVSSCPCARH